MPRTRNRKSNLQANKTRSKKEESVVDLASPGNESGDEISQTPESKKLKGIPNFAGPEFELRYTDMKLDTRQLITGAPIDSKLSSSLTD